MIPTLDEVNAIAQMQGKQAPDVGQVWRARNGTLQTVIKRDPPDKFLPAVHIKDQKTGRVQTVCLDGREAIMGWGSPLDLLEQVTPPTPLAP